MWSSRQEEEGTKSGQENQNRAHRPKKRMFGRQAEQRPREGQKTREASLFYFSSR